MEETRTYTASALLTNLLVVTKGFETRSAADAEQLMQREWPGAIAMVAFERQEVWQ